MGTGTALVLHFFHRCLLIVLLNSLYEFVQCARKSKNFVFIYAFLDSNNMDSDTNLYEYVWYNRIPNDANNSRHKLSSGYGTGKKTCQIPFYLFDKKTFIGNTRHGKLY